MRKLSNGEAGRDNAEEEQGTSSDVSHRRMLCAAAACLLSNETAGRLEYQ